MSRPIFRIGRAVAIALGLAYVGITAAVYAGQRSLQYHPLQAQPPPPPEGARDIRLTTSDGFELRAWASMDPNATRGVVMLHGNGGHRGSYASAFRRFMQMGLRPILVDYRGYGGSEGAPTEEGLYRDAQAAWDWLETQGIEDIVVWGRSLGTGVAVELARRNLPSALILDAPFDSAVNVGAMQYPWLPVSLLMKDRYESDQKIADIECPVLVMHGTEDRVIPLEFGRKLFEKAGEPKRWLEIEGAGHNNLEARAGTRYWRAITELIDGAPTDVP